MKHTATQYAKALYELTEGKGEEAIGKNIAGFLKLLERNGEMRKARAVMKRYGEIYDAKKGIIEAEVVSKGKLSEQAIHEIENHIRKKYAAKEVMIKNRIDEKVDGGMIIRIGDDVIDASIKNQLGKLKNKLIA